MDFRAVPRSLQSNPNPYRMATASPRSVYVHIPFCRHRCGYCNFSLVAGKDAWIEPFLDALDIEIQSVPGSHEIDTLFLGGGTPSHLSDRQLGRLGEIIFSKFRLAAGAEVSAECNPADISTSMLNSLGSLGVNRISLGVQSFERKKLQTLERDHDGETARRSFDLAMEQTGNVSMDLIFAAPNESASDWRSDLDAAIRLQPSHLSTYELTWEKGTTFWNRKTRGELDGSSEDLRLEMYLDSIDRCQGSGLSQYEVSSFAVSGSRCRHNLQYWLGNPWFAFGPGAASFTAGVRRTNHRSPTTWIKRTLAGESAVEETEMLSDRDRAIERIVFGLRMTDGIDVPAFEEASGVSLDTLAGDAIASLVQRELLERHQTVLKLTRRGLMLADTVSAELL